MPLSDLTSTNRQWVALCLFCLGCWTCLIVKAEENISPQKRQAIRELMEITGARANQQALTETFARQMISVLQAGKTEITPEAVRIIREEVALMIAQELAAERLQNRMYKLYARYFTLDEINGLVEFNSSPIGMKANRVMPVLLRESMSAAQAWSEDIAPEMSARVKARLEAEGFQVGS